MFSAREKAAEVADKVKAEISKAGEILTAAIVLAAAALIIAVAALVIGARRAG